MGRGRRALRRVCPGDDRIQYRVFIQYDDMGRSEERDEFHRTRQPRRIRPGRIRRGGLGGGGAKRRRSRGKSRGFGII